MKHALTMCCFCEKVRDDRESEPDQDVWREFKSYMDKYRLSLGDIRLFHAYCPGCLVYYQAFLSSSSEAAHGPGKGRQS